MSLAEEEIIETGKPEVKSLHISQIRIRNFRSIEAETVTLAPITVLYGHNSAGKSSLIYSLLTFKKIVENTSVHPSTFFDLIFVNLGNYKQVVFDHQEENIISFLVNIPYTNSVMEYGVSIRKTDGRFQLKMCGAVDIEFSIPVTFPYPLNQTDTDLINYNDVEYGFSWNGIVATAIPSENKEQKPVVSEFIVRTLNYCVALLRKIDFVPLKRGFTKLHYNPVGIASLATEDEIATVLIQDPYLEGKVDSYLQKIINRGFRRSIHPGTSMASLLTNEKEIALTVDLVNDGFGVNQLVYLLTKCLRSDVKLVCIEEPEVHLHPKAIRQLAKAFVEMSDKESKQFIISTHSEVFVAAILNLVAKGELHHNDVSFNLVTKKGKVSHFEPQEINSDGQVTGGLISFIEGELEELNEFFKIGGY